MSRKTLSKILIVAILAGVSSWRVIGHPSYLVLYANDPRSKQELRTNCTICHDPNGRATDANFLSDFGRQFKANRYRINEEMRQRFSDLFNSADQPVSGIEAETLNIAT